MADSLNDFAPRAKIQLLIEANRARFQWAVVGNGAAVDVVSAKYTQIMFNIFFK